MSATADKTPIHLPCLLDTTATTAIAMASDAAKGSGYSALPNGSPSTVQPLGAERRRMRDAHTKDADRVRVRIES